ncbi:unnamed protein product [Owenia fusiformis]|uniref:Uncharacterized protein n=1 Tax=Owenia fusiformis TaxID=6347 RepID=A0A8J1U3Y7_OWEFU|nr:unnamed protein product [Owenia fusiformis]
MSQMSFEPISDGVRDRIVNAQEYLSVKHALPKTKIPHALLHENHSQDRHLSIKLDELERRKKRREEVYEQSEKSFMDSVLKKQRQWKKDDEMRLGGMNLPTVYQEGTESRPSSMQVMYTTPRYALQDDALKANDNVLPYMTIRQERSEIIQHGDNTFVTKLPTIAEIDLEKLQRHSDYCGTAILHSGKAVSDPRFKRLTACLTIPYNPKSEETGENISDATDNGAAKDASERSVDIKTVSQEPRVQSHYSRRSVRSSRDGRSYQPGKILTIPVNSPSHKHSKSGSIFPSVLARANTTHSRSKPHSREGDTLKLPETLTMRKEKTDSELLFRKSKSQVKKSSQILQDLKTQNLRTLAQNYGLLSRSYGNLKRFRSRESVRTNRTDTAPCAQYKVPAATIKMFYK